MGIIYILASAGVTPNFFGPTQFNGTAPTGANTAYGWGPAKTAVTTPYYRGRLGAIATGGDAAVASSYNAGTTGPAKGTGTAATTAGDSFVAGPFAGTFAATTWTFNWNLRASTAGAIGHVNMRVWKSANADGSSATQLLANTVGLTVTLSTTADVNSSISWSPGALTLNNEYLFFQVEWQETTAGSSNNDNVFFRAGTASITTPNFTQNGSATIAGNATITANPTRLGLTYPANATIPGTGGDTNWIRNPRAEGAVTGSPGTLPTNWWFYGSETAVTRTIIGTGIEDGIPYIDIQFSATATTSNAYFVALEPYTAIPSFKGQRWNNSCYFRLMAGSISNVTIYIVSMEIDASSGQLGSSGFANSPKPTGAALKTQRMSVSYLTTQAAIAYIVPSWYLDYGAVGAAFDFTLRIGGPQFEDAASSASNLILPPVGSPQVSHRGVEGLPSSRMLAVAAISSSPTITADGSNFFGGNATITGSATITADGSIPSLAIDGAATIVGQGGKTNYVTNPRAEGAAAGTPGTIPSDWWRIITDDGGIQTQIVGTGTENGIPYLDVRFFGTSSGTRNGYIFPVLPGSGIPVHTGYTPYFSCYMRSVAGTVPPADVTAGLVTRWKLSDGSGLDLSVSANTGVFHGGATPTTSGPIGNAALFDGSSGYVSSTIVINIPYVSLSVWIKTGTTAGNQWICGFADGLGSGTTDKFLYIDSSGHPAFYIYSAAAGSAVATGTVRIDDNNWHHVVATYTDSLLSVYVDGVLDATNPYIYGGSYTGYSVPNIILGGYGAVNATMWTPGTFDDFRVYNRALTAAEVSTLYAGASSIGANFSVILYAYSGTSFITSYFGNYPSTQLDQPGGLSTRFSVSHIITTSGSPDNAIAAANIWFNAGAIDITIRFGGPQLELNNVTGLILPPVGSPGISTRGIEVHEQVIAIASITTIAGQGGKTNYIINPRAENAVAGTPGTPPSNWWSIGSNASELTRQIIGTGIENGIPYIDVRFSGTSTGGYIDFDPAWPTTVSSSYGDSWAGSFFIRMTAGSTAGITGFTTQIDAWDASTNWIGNPGATTYSLALLTQPDGLSTRFAIAPQTYSYPTMAFVVLVVFFPTQSGQAIDITLRFGAPQLERNNVTSLMLPPVGSPAITTRGIEASATISTSGAVTIAGQSGKTNYIRNPRGEGAVAPATMPTLWDVEADSGTTIDVVGRYVVNGVDVVRFHFYGTPNQTTGALFDIMFEYVGGPSPSIITGMPDGQQYTRSFYLRLVAGSWTNVPPWVTYGHLWDNSIHNLGVPQMTVIFPTDGTLTRIVDTLTATGGTGGPYKTSTYGLIATATSFTPFDVTFDIGGAQFELGPNVTSLMVPPVGVLAASTRAIEADAIVAKSANALISGSATVVANPALSIPMTATIAGAATLIATPKSQASGSAIISGIATIAATPKSPFGGSASIAGTATVAATPKGPIRASATIAGVATFTATPKTPISASAAIAGVATIAATPQGSVRANATITGVATITATPIRTVPATANITNASTVTATPNGLVPATATIANAPTITATPIRSVPAAANIAGVATITATATQGAAPGTHLIGVSGAGQVGFETELVTKRLTGVSGAGQAGTPSGPRPYVVVTLHSDNAGVPGSQIAVLGNIYDADVAAGLLATGGYSSLAYGALSGLRLQNVRLQLVPPISLSPGTRYWIKLSDGISTPTSLAWVAAGDPSGIGVSPELWNKPSSSGANNTSVAYEMRVLSPAQEQGVSAVGSVGNLTLSYIRPPVSAVGVAGIGRAGIEGKLVAKTLIGRVATGQAGIEGKQITKPLTGRVATGQVGILGKSIGKQLIGRFATGQAGIEGKQVAKPLIGRVATGQAGSLTISRSKQLTGVSGTGQAGIEGKQITKPLIGRVATGQVGSESELVAKRPTGISGTGLPGILGKSIGKQLIGRFATGQAGSLTVSLSKTQQLTGVSSTGQAGIEGKLVAKLLVGRTAFGQVGAISVQAGVSKTLQLTGVSGIGQVGVLGKLIAKKLTGVTGVGQPGLESELVAKRPIGTSGIGQVGILGKSIGKQLFGVSGTGQVGIEGKQEAKPLTGRVAVGQAGTLGKSIGKQLIGVSGSGQAGIEVKQTAKSALGIAASGQPGILGKLIAKPLTGVSGTGRAGAISVQAGVSKTLQLTGVSGIGQVGVLGKLIAKKLTGVSGVGLPGLESELVAKRPIGISGSGQVGILGKSIAKQLFGVSGIGQAGIEGKQEAKPLTGRGVSGALQVGILGKLIAKQLFGVSGIGQVGSITISLSKTRQLTGVVGIGQAGILGKLIAKQLIGVSCSGQAGIEGKLVAKPLTGRVATSQIGVLGKLIAKQLFGVSGIGQVGLESELVAKRPIGISGIGQAGILGKSISKQLIGVAGIGQVGVEGKQEAKPLTGVSGIGQVGILGKSISKQLIGVSGIGQAGTEGKLIAKQLTGRVATGQVGILGKSIGKQLIGVSCSGQAGTEGKLVAKPLPDRVATGQVGILRPSISKQLIGVSCIGQAGTEGKLVAKPLNGIAAIGQVGILRKSIGKQLVGVSGTGQVGILGKLIVKLLTGIAGAGQAGALGLAAQVISTKATGQAGILKILIAKPLIGIAAAGKAGNTSVLAGQSRTQALTGIAAIGQTNILGKLITKPLLGRVATGQVGVVSASISKQLLGRIATGQVGILGKSISKQLLGVAGSGQVGIEGKLVAKALAGRVSTGQVGILGKSISKQIFGIAGTGQAGTEGKLVAKSLLGGIATGQVGILGKSITKQLLGVTANGQAGTEGKLVAKSLLGGIAIGQVGILGKTISKQLFGVSGTGQAGIEGKLVAKPLSGLTGIGQVGILGKSIGKQLFGVSGTGQVGAEDKLVVKPLAGIAAAGQVGILGKSISKQLFGVSGSGEAGIEGKLIAKPLDGVAGAGQAGITVAVTGQVTRPFGVIAAGQAGILVTFIAKTLDGVEATGQVGTIRAQSGEPTVRLTGVTGAGQVGILETIVAKTLVGVGAAGQVGIPSIEIVSTLRGTSGNGEVGSTVKKVTSAFSGTTAIGSTSGITARIAIQLGGAVATGRVSSLVAGGELKSSSGVGIAGSVSGKLAVPLSGTSASGATGHLGAKISVILTGAVSGIGQVGSVVPTGAVPGGVQGVGGVGNLTAVVSDEHVTIGIGGVQGNGEAGDLPMGKKKRPGGRGAPTRLRPHLFSPPEEFPESPAEAIARWRRIVDDVLEPKEPAIEGVPEEPTEVDVGVVAVAKLHGDELIDDTLDRLRRIAEAEDILLLNDFVQIDEIAGTEAEDLFLLGDLI